MHKQQHLEDIICSYLLIPLVIGAAIIMDTPGRAIMAETAGAAAEISAPPKTGAIASALPDHDTGNRPDRADLATQYSRSTSRIPVVPPLDSAGGMQAAAPAAAPEKPPLHDANTASWHIQIASLSSPDSAQQLLDRVRARGIPAVQQVVTVGGKPHWRILVSGFQTRADAESRVQLLRDQLGNRGYWIHREQAHL